MADSSVQLLAATADHVDVSVAAASGDLLAVAAFDVSILAVSRLLAWDPARCICEPGSRLPGNSANNQCLLGVVRDQLVYVAAVCRRAGANRNSRQPNKAQAVDVGYLRTEDTRRHTICLPDTPGTITNPALMAEVDSGRVVFRCIRIRSVRPGGMVKVPKVPVDPTLSRIVVPVDLYQL